nr:putative ribonuclease H-like domain-containing protein [Tanacetum cinerariifolium]
MLWVLISVKSRGADRRDTGNTRYKARDNGKRHVKHDEHKAMVTIDEEGVDWTGHAEHDIEDYALMAFNSSKSGSHTEMSAKDKNGLGYGSQIHDRVLSYETKVFESVFDSRSSDVEDSPMNDRFVKVEGMHAFPSPMIGNYMPPKSDFRMYESKFTYSLKQSTTSESDAKTSDLDSCESSTSKETLETMPKLVEFKPKVVNEPKVWSDAPIIEEYESDSDDEYVSKALVEQEKPRNKAYLVDYQDFNGGLVAFGGSKGQITAKEEQDFTNIECLVLSPDFKLPDENQVLLRVPRQNNMYSFNLENIVPSRGLACLIAKATVDESNKWHMSVKMASTPIETKKPLVNYEEAADVDVDLYRSMIGSLMYLTASRPDIMESAFDLEAYLDSDYAGANLDRKSTIRGCQFLSRRLISWQCKKQTIIATSTIEAEYVAAASYRGQVLWIQNQMLNYGFNFMSTKIYIDNESTICLVCAAQSCFTMVMLLRLGKKMQFGLVLEALNGNSEVSATRHKNTASSQTINDEKQIHAIVDSKAVVVKEASIRSSLLFNDADGTACLTNEAIFQNLALMGYEGDQPPMTKSSSSPDTTQDSRDSFKGTNESEGDQVQSPYNSPFLGGHTSNRPEGALNLKELFSICTNLSNRVLALETIMDAQAAEIIALKARIKKLEKKCKPSISYHKAWLKSVKRLSMKKRFRKKESVSKQGRKKDKPKLTLDDSILDGFDADHGMDYVDTDEPVNKWRLSKVTKELKLTTDIEFAQDKSNAPLTKTTTTFNDEDITMAQTLIKMKEEKAKEKGDKGKCVLKEPEPAKKMTRNDLDFAQIAKDAEVARLVYEEELAELERENEKKQGEEEASKAVIAEMYDEVQERIEADALFVAKLQQEKREEYTIKERAKFLAETIAAQRRFRAAQRSAEIKSRPLTKSQLRNLMMTYLKNMGSYKHFHLKEKTFVEIQGLYERKKRMIDDFKPMDSDDAVDKEKVLKEPDSTKVKVKQEGDELSIENRPGRRLKMKATKKSKRQKIDSNLKEEEHLKTFL